MEALRVHIAYWVLLGISSGFFICAVIAFYMGYKNRQFEDIEQAKYEMMEDSTNGIHEKTDDKLKTGNNKKNIFSI